MARLDLINEGGTAGIWAKARTGSSATLQANATSATLMLYPNERGTDTELPFVLGVSHSVDKSKTEGFLQIPTMEGERKTRYYTFADLIRALDAADKYDALAARVALLEAARDEMRDRAKALFDMLPKAPRQA